MNADKFDSVNGAPFSYIDHFRFGEGEASLSSTLFGPVVNGRTSGIRSRFANVPITRMDVGLDVRPFEDGNEILLIGFQPEPQIGLSARTPLVIISAVFSQREYGVDFVSSWRDAVAGASDLAFGACGNVETGLRDVYSGVAKPVGLGIELVDPTTGQMFVSVVDEDPSGPVDIEMTLPRRLLCRVADGLEGMLT